MPSPSVNVEPRKTAGQGLKVEKGAADEALPWFTTTNDAYAQDLYRDEIQGQDLEAFMEEKDMYDVTEKRWPIPEVPTTREDIFNSVLQVIRSVLGMFVEPTNAGVEREVVETYAMKEGDIEEGAIPRFPTLVVRAAGPSFEIPNSQSAPVCQIPGLGYANIATYFSVKIDSEIGDAEQNLKEMVPHARRIFREQPNRRHVRSLIVTERRARLVHFDRAGCQITPPFDIHQNPSTFVRLLSGLASTNERTLGLDDSVQWTIVEGRKCQGTLTTTGPNGERKSYRILEHLPIPRGWIFGKATTCWRVQDPDTLEEFVVKDSWRLGDHPAEHELLELVKGIPGVVQMTAYEAEREETKDFRCPTTSGRYYNRISTRVTMKAYGRSIESFTSLLQLLCALRDAIAGHQRLVGEDLRILHRDISQNNILLGNEDAPEGERGVIIDLDLAFKATEHDPVISVDHTTGTRVFQSLSVLDGHSMKRDKHPHDYLDDLESFFYVLTYLFLVFKPNGSRVSSKEEGPSVVWQWANQCPDTASYLKRAVFDWGEDASTAIEVTEKRWGSACLALFEQYRQWVFKVRGDKRRLLFDVKLVGRSDILDPLHAQRDEHYAAVLKMFDDAIDAARKSDRSTVSPSKPAEYPADSAPLPSTTEAPPVDLPAHVAMSSRVIPDILSTAVPPVTPLRVSPPLPLYPSPTLSTLRSKRPSHDGDHPHSPPVKVRRIHIPPIVASRAP